jgi:hypothetical protein
MESQVGLAYFIRLRDPIDIALEAMLAAVLHGQQPVTVAHPVAMPPPTDSALREARTLPTTTMGSSR